MSQREQKNLRTGLLLGLLVLGLSIYSLVVIRTRGQMSEPANLSRLQKVLRGL